LITGGPRTNKTTAGKVLLRHISSDKDKIKVKFLSSENVQEIIAELDVGKG